MDLSWQAVPGRVDAEVRRWLPTARAYFKQAGHRSTAWTPPTRDALTSPEKLAAALTGCVLASGFGHVQIPLSADLFDHYASTIELSPRIFKHAGMDAGGLFVPKIPVDRFNQAIWYDVTLGGTTPSAAASVSGLLAGTAAITAKPQLSAFDIATTTATAGAKGYGIGMFVGRTLGALAGMSPEQQAELRRAGLWGGIINGLANTVFAE